MAAASFFDRVKVSVTGTPGTGSITLAGAASGFRTFAGAGVPNGAVVSYVIEDGTNWEVGHGTYTSSGTSLSRDTVLGSSAGGTTKISATSGALVYISALAADLSLRGELGPIDPPAASLFTPDAGATLTDYPGRGLSMSVVYSGTSGAQYKAVKAKPGGTSWTVTGRMRASGFFYSFPAAGLIIYDNAASKGMWVGKNANSTSSTSVVTSVNVQRTQTGLAYNGTANTEPQGDDTPWYRIATDGTTLYFLASADGIIWTELFEEGLTSYTSAFDKIGLYFSTPGATNGSSGVAVTRNMGLLCTYYKEESVLNLTGAAT